MSRFWAEPTTLASCQGPATRPLSLAGQRCAGKTQLFRLSIKVLPIFLYYRTRLAPTWLAGDLQRVLAAQASYLLICLPELCMSTLVPRDKHKKLFAKSIVFSLRLSASPPLSLAFMPEMRCAVTAGEGLRSALPVPCVTPCGPRVSSCPLDDLLTQSLYFPVLFCLILNRHGLVRRNFAPSRLSLVVPKASKTATPNPFTPFHLSHLFLTPFDMYVKL